MTSIRGVLFDLDGTLLDTIPDLAYTLNQLRAAENLPAIPLATIRPIATLGSKAMIKRAFNMDESHPNFTSMREKFFAHYAKHIAHETKFFPQMETVLNHLDDNDIPWGIVTNKLTIHTQALLKALRYDHRPACIVCGDSLQKAKPEPEPILHACKMLQKEPNSCLYVGDAATDVIASKAAGTKSLVALYGYIGEHEDPYSWNADGYIREPIEIIKWLNK